MDNFDYSDYLYETTNSSIQGPDIFVELDSLLENRSILNKYSESFIRYIYENRGAGERHKMSYLYLVDHYNRNLIIEDLITQWNNTSARKRNIARIFAKRFWHVLVCTQSGTDKSEWSYFKGPWWETGKGWHDICGYLDVFKEEFEEIIPGKQLEKLESSIFFRRVSSFLHWSDWKSYCETDSLLCGQDGVINLDEDVLYVRYALPGDFCTLRLPYKIRYLLSDVLLQVKINDLKEMLEKEEDPVEIEDIKAQIEDVEIEQNSKLKSEREFLMESFTQICDATQEKAEKWLDVACLSLRGGNKHKISVGMASKYGFSGKTSFCNTMASTMGKRDGYAGTAPSNYFNSKGGSSNSATPVLKGLIGKRFVIVPELARYAKLIASIIKFNTGRDYVYYRGLYKEGDIGRIGCIFYMTWNLDILLDIDDVALKRRLIFLLNNTSFEDPKSFKKIEELYKELNVVLIEEGKADEMEEKIEAMFQLLLIHYIKYKRNGEVKPESQEMEDDKENFFERHNVVKRFYKCILKEELGEQDPEIPNVDSLFEEFKRWYRNRVPSGGITNITTFLNRLRQIPGIRISENEKYIWKENGFKYDDNFEPDITEENFDEFIDE